MGDFEPIERPIPERLVDLKADVESVFVQRDGFLCTGDVLSLLRSHEIRYCSHSLVVGAMNNNLVNPYTLSRGRRERNYYSLNQFLVLAEAAYIADRHGSVVANWLTKVNPELKAHLAGTFLYEEIGAPRRELPTTARKALEGSLFSKEQNPLIEREIAVDQLLCEPPYSSLEIRSVDDIGIPLLSLIYDDLEEMVSDGRLKEDKKLTPGMLSKKHSNLILPFEADIVFMIGAFNKLKDPEGGVFPVSYGECTVADFISALNKCIKNMKIQQERMRTQVKNADFDCCFSDLIQSAEKWLEKMSS